MTDKQNNVSMHPLFNKLDRYYVHPIQEWPIIARGFYNVMAFLLWALSKLLFRWTVQGDYALKFVVKERKQANESGVIVACNHVSAVEPPLLLAYGWSHRFRLRPLYKASFNRFPLVQWLFTHMGAIPVDRKQEDPMLLRRCQRILRGGDSLLIFPEGTRVNKHKKPVPFHRGLAVIARLAKTDVYPAAVVGAMQITEHGIPLPHKIRFAFGDRLVLSEAEGQYKKEYTVEFTQLAERKVFELRDMLRSEYPRML